MTLFLAYNLLSPFVAGMQYVISQIDSVTHNLGWSLIILAALLRLMFWPLTRMQFASMAKMQALQPRMKELQARHKDDTQRLNTELMALYKEHGTNPFASCLPLVVQLPFLYSIYWAITGNKQAFSQTHWCWIGSGFSLTHAHILATSLAAPDLVLLALYVVSMFFNVKLASPPSSDPQQAQTQQIMAFVSPVMIAFIGRSWPSGLMLFWLASNIFQTIQQVLLMRGRRVAPANTPIPVAETSTVPVAKTSGRRRNARRSK